MDEVRVFGLTQEERLVRQALYVPDQEAKRWHHTPLEQDDLVAEGRLALVRAAKRFDPRRGVPFSAFARHFVRGALISLVREKAKKERLSDGGYPVWQSLDHPLAGSFGRGDSEDLYLEIEDPRPSVEDHVIFREQLRMIETLPDKEYYVLTRTIIQGVDATEVAEELGVSADRVYQLSHAGMIRARRRAA